MRRSLPLLALATLLLAGLAAAQDTPAPAATETSFFGMFFWSDDPVGLIFIWVLVLLSVLSLTLALRFALQFRRANLLPPRFAHEIRQLLLDRKFREALDTSQKDGSFLGDLTAAALAEAPSGYDAMERTLFETGDAETAKTLRPLEALNVLGNIAPMMGLFGTVYGMIVAFQSLVSSGGSPDPVQLAGGISTALVTTLWGLVVAIPALAAYALLHNRVDAIAADAVLEAEGILKPFRPSTSKQLVVVRGLIGVLVVRVGCVLLGLAGGAGRPDLPTPAGPRGGTSDRRVEGRRSRRAPSARRGAQARIG